MDVEVSIPANDPVRLISQFVEEMDLTALYGTYDRMPSGKYASPEIMLKITIRLTFVVDRLYQVPRLQRKQKDCSRSTRLLCRTRITRRIDLFPWILHRMPLGLKVMRTPRASMRKSILRITAQWARNMEKSIMADRRGPVIIRP